MSKESFRERYFWRSIFDDLELEDDPNIFNPSLLNPDEDFLLTVNLFVTHNLNENIKMRTCNFVLGGFFYNYRDPNDKSYKNYSLNYQTAWLEEIPTALIKKNKEGNFVGGFKLSKKDVNCTLQFEDEKDQEQVRRLQKKVCINLDFEDQYMVEERIGHGASGNVYKIYNINSKKRFAGKFIGKEYLKKTTKRVRSIINEMAVLRKMDHPYIVKQFSVHEVSEHIILVMEQLEGEALHPDLFKKCVVPEAEIKFIFCQLLTALKSLNDHGIMHRDIKPNNLRFTQKYTPNVYSNTIKLIDFGFVEYWASKKYTRYYCGTVGYMCPFIMNNNKHSPKNYGPECDLFSVGVLLYFCLAREKIFNGKNHEEKRKLNKACTIDFEKLEKSNISLYALDLIRRQLIANPKDRFNMKEVIGHPLFESRKLQKVLNGYYKPSYIEDNEIMNELSEKKNRISNEFDKNVIDCEIENHFNDSNKKNYKTKRELN